MPSVYQVKPAFQNLLRPLARRLARAGVSANQVTVAALLLSLAAGGLLVRAAEYPALFLLLPPAMLLRMALNAVDGMLAREHGMKTALGAFLNELGDVVSDAALYLPFALIGGIRPALVVGVTLAAAVSEMAGVAAFQVGASRRYDGPMGKSDRALLFGALALILGLGAAPGGWFDAAMGLTLLLLLLTVVNRVRGALPEIAS